MSTEARAIAERVRSAGPCRTLAEYVAELIGRLDDGDPVASRRLRRVVGTRTARITLDDETVVVRFVRGTLVVRDADADHPADGSGATDRATTLDLLDARIEVTEAILDGRIDVVGRDADVQRIFLAIEILLHSAPRVPALQTLARDYRRDPCRPVKPTAARATVPTALGPNEPSRTERGLLKRLDLMPQGARRA
jgi:hypothetical protein